MSATAQHQLPVARRVAGCGLLAATATLLAGATLPVEVALADDPPPTSPDPAPSAEGEGGADMTPLELSALVLVNAARANAGLVTLQWDAAMAVAARDHARDMMQGGFVSHAGSDGSSRDQRLRRAGVRFNLSSENIWTYWGKVPEEGPRMMHSAMMSERLQPGVWNHIWSILNPAHRRIGIGIAINPNGVQYMCQDFAD
jgi:uncharacterized protein YkwD